MFHFELVSLSGKKFDEDVYEVILPTLDGNIGVLKDHMPLISVATVGPVVIRRQARDAESKREYFAISGGAIEVSRNQLRVLVDEADHATELNEAEVQKALERAQKMKAEAKDQVSLDHAQTMVDRSQVRLHVAGLRRRHKK